MKDLARLLLEMIGEGVEDKVLKDLKNKAKFGDKVTFHGEKGAARGGGEDASMNFYFVELAPIWGKEGAYLSKKKPDPQKLNTTHMYVTSHRMGLGAILPINPSSRRPNAMTLGFIRDVDIR